MKIVVNKCYGGFRLSDKAEEMLAEAIGVSTDDIWGDNYREHPALVAIVEELGLESYDDDVSELTVVEIPEDATDWELSDYDGYEDIIYVLDGKIYHA